jgi:hypothetical protein
VTAIHSDDSINCGDDPPSLERLLELAQRSNWNMIDLEKLVADAKKDGNFSSPLRQMT